MKLACLSVLLLLPSCSFIEVKSSCGLEDSYTVVENDTYKAFIYFPDSQTEPSIWEGPICVENKKTRSMCQFDESLIKSVVFLKPNSLSITTFSGSNSKEWSFNTETCVIDKN